MFTAPAADWRMSKWENQSINARLRVPSTNQTINILTCDKHFPAQSINRLPQTRLIVEWLTDSGFCLPVVPFVRSNFVYSIISLTFLTIKTFFLTIITDLLVSSKWDAGACGNSLTWVSSFTSINQPINCWTKPVLAVFIFLVFGETGTCLFTI